MIKEIMLIPVDCRYSKNIEPRSEWREESSRGVQIVHIVEGKESVVFRHCQIFGTYAVFNLFVFKTIIYMPIKAHSPIEILVGL